MMHYAYTPTAEGTEPLGTSGRIISREFTTHAGFIRYARRVLGSSARCFHILGERFYNDAMHKRIA